MSNEKKTYETEILEAIHETIADLYEADLVNESTMKEFDDICLKPNKKYILDNSIKSRHIEGRSLFKY